MKKQKILCENCSHFSSRATDNGFVVGCSIWKNAPDLFAKIHPEMMKEQSIIDGEGNSVASIGVDLIDTKFILNKNGDCEFFNEQTPAQKQAKKQYETSRKKAIFNRILQKLSSWVN